MRALQKAAVPPTIRDKQTELTESYKADRTRRPWTATDILLSLRAETLGKCAYCESKVDAVTWIHVEHLKPKALFPDLVVEWSNLTLACPKCNIAKGDHYDTNAPLINPYAVAPDDHLMFEWDLLLPTPGSELGRFTILKLELNRLDLKERRDRALDLVAGLVFEWGRAPATMKASLAELVADNAEDGVEYVMFIRAFLDRAGFPWRGIVASR